MDIKHVLQVKYKNLIKIELEQVNKLVLFLIGGNNVNKIINLKNINKTLAIAMVLIIMLCNVKSVFAISGSGSGNWTGGQYDSYFKTTESIAYNRGILIRKLTNVDTGEKITVFCAEHTEDFVVGTVNNGNYYIYSC